MHFGGSFYKRFVPFLVLDKAQRSLLSYKSPRLIHICKVQEDMKENERVLLSVRVDAGVHEMNSIAAFLFHELRLTPSSGRGRLSNDALSLRHIKKLSQSFPHSPGGDDVGIFRT